MPRTNLVRVLGNVLSWWLTARASKDPLGLEMHVLAPRASTGARGAQRMHTPRAQILFQREGVAERCRFVGWQGLVLRFSLGVTWRIVGHAQVQLRVRRCLQQI